MKIPTLAEMTRAAYRHVTSALTTEMAVERVQRDGYTKGATVERTREIDELRRRGNTSSSPAVRDAFLAYAAELEAAAV